MQFLWKRPRHPRMKLLILRKGYPRLRGVSFAQAGIFVNGAGRFLTE